MRSRKLLLGAALTLLAVSVIIWWSGITASASNGQFYSDCLQECNRRADVCRTQCGLDCEALYPGDRALISACVTTCRDVCAAQYKDCKVAAKFECKLLCVPGDPPPCPQ